MKIKKTIAIILITVMLMTGVTVNADTSIGEKAMSMIKNQLEILRLQAKNVQSFVAIMEELIPLVLSELKDIKKSDWFTENVALLYGMNIVQGDGLGNFLPNKEVTGSEYLKMVVVALDNETYKAPAGQQWDKPYIDRALELGLVKSGDIADYRKPLNRYNMARIIVRACAETYGDYSKYQNSLTDYSRMPAEFKDFVLKAYSKGIINGYPDGTFGGENTMKRSEATAVIARLIDPNQRITPKDPSQLSEYEKLVAKIKAGNYTKDDLIAKSVIELDKQKKDKNYVPEPIIKNIPNGDDSSFAWLELVNYRDYADDVMIKVHCTNFTDINEIRTDSLIGLQTIPTNSWQRANWRDNLLFDIPMSNGKFTGNTCEYIPYNFKSGTTFNFIVSYKRNNIEKSFNHSLTLK